MESVIKDNEISLETFQKVQPINATIAYHQLMNFQVNPYWLSVWIRIYQKYSYFNSM